MTLTTHAIVGASAMSVTVNTFGITPTGMLLGFAAGFVSHYAIDTIPHWAEGKVLLRTRTFDASDPLSGNVLTGKDKYRDLALISADGLLGLFISWFVFNLWLFQMPLQVIFLGAAAGEMPDALQFLYFKTRMKIMEPLQKMHHSLQTEHSDIRFLLIEVCLAVLAVGATRLFA